MEGQGNGCVLVTTQLEGNLKRGRQDCVAALAAAVTLALSGSASAQTAVQSSTQIAAADLPEQVVITGRLEEDLPVRLSQTGTRVDTVTALDIKNGGYVDVGQALQTTVPGLYISPKNGPFDYVDVSLQGSRTQDVLWLVDGVRINNRLYGGTTPLDTLPSGMIERIEVLEGPQALFYGTQGIAGAINIITKDFSDAPSGALTVGGDTNSTRHLDGFFRDTLNGNHFVVYGSSDVSQGFRPFRAQDFQPSATDRNRDYNVLTLGGKYAYDFTNDLRLTVTEQHTDAKLDYARPQLAATSYNERNEDILSSKLDYTPSDTLQFFVKGYYHWWYAHFTEFDNDPSNPGHLTVIDNHDFWGFTDYGASALAKFEPTPGIDYYLGYDFQNYTGKDVVLVITQKTEHVHAVFGEVATTQDLIPNVKLAAGFRYNAPSFGPSATVWNLSGRWDVTNSLFLKGMVGTAFRLPTAEELFANDPNDERGDLNLKPEKSTNANASIGGYLGMPDLRWEVIGFYRDVDNLIDFESFDSLTNQSVFGNVPGTVRVRGGEFILDAAVNDDLSASGSYTYSPARESGGQQVSRIPEQLAKASVDYHPSNLPFGLFFSANYVGKVFDSQAGLTHVNYGGYVVFNVSGRVFLDTERRHRLDLSLFNIFDRQYASSLAHGVSDVSSTSYVVENLGLPRTLQIRYTYNFQ